MRLRRKTPSHKQWYRILPFARPHAPARSSRWAIVACYPHSRLREKSVCIPGYGEPTPQDLGCDAAGHEAFQIADSLPERAILRGIDLGNLVCCQAYEPTREMSGH